MTYEEAYKILTEHTRNYVGLKDAEALEVAIGAVEKQIPKKPIKKNPICYEKTKDGQECFAFDYFCPNCNKKVKLFESHCDCGQAVDWSGEQ